MRVFPVRLPSGAQYWTVLDDDLAVVDVADQFLRHTRFGRDRAESTTKAYAGGVVLYLRWCAASDRDWRTAARELSSFMTWLRYTPAHGAEDSVLRLGPGAAPVRGERRMNRVLIAVREFLRFAVSVGEVPSWVLGELYELADTSDLPAELQATGARFRVGVRHRVSEPRRPIDRASDTEIVAMLTACRSARDRLILLLLARAGLRRGEVTGLRRSDVHLGIDNAVVGCLESGAHVHIRRRDNPNGAWAKSRNPATVPVDHLVVRAFDQYAAERRSCPPAATSDFVLVNLFREPQGAPMPPGAINELVEALAHRAELTRHVTPHMARHAFASNVIDAGGTVDDVQHLLRHASPTAARVYLHPDQGRLRAAVERVGTPRLPAEGPCR